MLRRNARRRGSAKAPLLPESTADSSGDVTRVTDRGFFA
jgi:hypothetical protein